MCNYKVLIATLCEIERKSVDPMFNFLLAYLRYCPVDHGKSRIAKMIKLEMLANPIIYRTKMGVSFELDVTQHVMRNIFLYDAYERNTIRHMAQFAKPDMTYVDCGTNIGFHSLTMAKLLSEGTVHAFEPVSSTYSHLLRNLKLNKFHNVKVNRVGVSDREEDKEIFFEIGRASKASLHRSGTQSETIKLTTLDRYCQDNNIEKIDMLKIDVEGNEPFVLEGAKRIVDQSPNMMLVLELVDQHLRKAGTSSTQMFNRIQDMGFKAYYPKGWPLPLKRCASCPPPEYSDNIIFLKS